MKSFKNHLVDLDKLLKRAEKRVDMFRHARITADIELSRGSTRVKGNNLMVNGVRHTLANKGEGVISRGTITLYYMELLSSDDTVKGDRRLLFVLGATLLDSKHLKQTLNLTLIKAELNTNSNFPTTFSLSDLHLLYPRN